MSAIEEKKYLTDKYATSERMTAADLRMITALLRSPDGCPWDSTQTYESMKKCVTDEAAEVVEAVDNEDFINLREELGDLMLQVLMYAEIAQERQEFTLDDVIDELAKKLVRRHPNVFGDEEMSRTPGEGLSVWKRVKKEEKLGRLKEYEKMYEQGKIPLKAIEKQREKCRILEAQEGAE